MTRIRLQCDSVVLELLALTREAETVLLMQADRASGLANARVPDPFIWYSMLRNSASGP